MKTKLNRCRNSLFAYIPQAVVEHFNLKVGEKLDFRIEGEYIKAIPVHSPGKMHAQAAAHEPIKAGECHES